MEAGQERNARETERRRERKKEKKKKKRERSNNGDNAKKRIFRGAAVGLGDAATRTGPGEGQECYWRKETLHLDSGTVGFFCQHAQRPNCLAVTDSSLHGPVSCRHWGAVRHPAWRTRGGGRTQK